MSVFAMEVHENIYDTSRDKSDFILLITKHVANLCSKSI